MSVNYTFILDMSEILDYIYIWVFLVNIESVLLLALVKYMLCSHFTQNCILLYFLEEKILVLWRKIVENPLIFVYLFCPKNGAIVFATVGRIKLADTSLNHIFNALSIGVEYTLSFQLTSFGLNCLLYILFKKDTKNK